MESKFEKIKPSPGELARQQHMKPGEYFVTNAYTEEEIPTMDEISRSAQEIASDLEKTGKYESVRVVDTAYSEDGELLNNNAMVVVKPKAE